MYTCLFVCDLLTYEPDRLATLRAPQFSSNKAFVRESSKVKLKSKKSYD